MGESLWRWIVHEFDTLLNAAFQPSLASFEKLLLLIVCVRQDVCRLLRSRGLNLLIYSTEGEFMTDVPRAPRAQRSNQAQFLW